MSSKSLKMRTARPQLETLEHRLTPAFTSSFNKQDHILTILGTAAAEVGVISRTPTGAILLNNRATGATISTTDTVRVLAREGGDTVILNLTNGAFAPGFSPEAGVREIEFFLDGGPGEDILRVQGGGGNDRFDLGRMQNEVRMNWNNDGDADVFPVAFERYQLNGGKGNDWMNANGNGVTGAPMSLPMEMMGEAGHDTIRGGLSKDSLQGGEGNDSIQGGSGDDCLYGNNGNDTMDGGAGRDTLWGDAGDDRLNGGTSGGVSDDACDELHGGTGKDVFSWDLAILLAEDEKAVSDYIATEDA